MQTFTKSQLPLMQADGAYTTDAVEPTDNFDDLRSRPVVCANAAQIVLLIDWNPGDEEYLDIMATFSCDKEGGQFYRMTQEDGIGNPPMLVDGDYKRLEMETFDESVDGNPDQSADPIDGNTAPEPVTHYCAVKFDVRGTHARFRFRGKRKSELEVPLDPGTIKVHYSVRV